jgi:hypothetical protein
MDGPLRGFDTAILTAEIGQAFALIGIKIDNLTDNNEMIAHLMALMNPAG